MQFGHFVDAGIDSIIRGRRHLPNLPSAFFQSSAMPTACRISGTSAIHQGDRPHQQDQVALMGHPRIPGCILAVVADGMGGRSGGRAAADQVLMTAQQLFAGYAPPQDSGARLLQNLATQAHTVIRLTAISSEQEPHSTLAAFVLDPDGSMPATRASTISAMARWSTARATTRMCRRWWTAAS
jgi:hypothetical protein